MLHPGLASHPQHNLAMSQSSACGPIFSFVLDGGQQAMAFLNALELVDISNNIGDSRILCCHPWSTTHYGVSEEARSEEHTSELWSLMRITYAVFSLKKKKTSTI